MCIVFVCSLPAFRNEGECRHVDHRCVLSVCFHIHPEVMESALSADMLATDLAYYLVRKGVSQNSLPCHFFSFLRELMPVSVLDIRTMSGGIVCIQHQRDHTAPVCSHRHQHLCTRYKSQTLAVVPLFGHTKILHTLIGMGSAALKAAVS